MSGIQMALLGAGTDDQLQLIGYTASIIDFLPVTGGLGYRLTDGGKEETATGTATSFPYVPEGDWVIPNGSASLYEVRATLNSGSLTTGTTGSWLSLGTTREWTLTRSTAGISAVSLTIDIRLIGGPGTILATAPVNLDIELN
jgi:hypothetical protein